MKAKARSLLSGFWYSPISHGTGDAEFYKNNFSQAVVKVLQQRDEFPLRQMVDYINQGFTWSRRSPRVQWLNFLKGSIFFVQDLRSYI